MKAASASRGNDRDWGAALSDRWGMAGRGGLVGQGQRAGAVQSKHDEDGSADHGRRYRAIHGSGLVKGIGPILAKKLAEKFGAEVLTVIETRTAEPEIG
jgi:hypothetical protein